MYCTQTHLAPAQMYIATTEQSNPYMTANTFNSQVFHNVSTSHDSFQRAINLNKNTADEGEGAGGTWTVQYRNID